MSKTRLLPYILSPLLWVGTSGCDVIGETALQSGEASLRTLVDLLLTDVANQVADALLADNLPPDAGDGDMDGTDGMDDMDGMDGTDGDGGDNGDMDDGMPPADDPIAAGEAVVADSCSACHGADGASGFAPDIQGASEETISEAVGGGGGHIPIELSDDDTANVTAYLNSF